MGGLPSPKLLAKRYAASATTTSTTKLHLSLSSAMAPKLWTGLCSAMTPKQGWAHWLCAGQRCPNRACHCSLCCIVLSNAPLPEKRISCCFSKPPRSNQRIGHPCSHHVCWISGPINITFCKRIWAVSKESSVDNDAAGCQANLVIDDRVQLFSHRC